MIFNRSRNKNKDKKEVRRGNSGPSIITSDVVIDGNLMSGGELQIDGEVNGAVRARAVVVDINGSIHGEVAADDVVVRGRIIGPIRGRHVHILNGSHVEGDILNESVSIENGAYVDGKIQRTDDPLGESYVQDQQGNSRYPAPQLLPYGHEDKQEFDGEHLEPSLEEDKNS